MFAVIYQAHIFPGMEEAYQKLWRQIATYFIQHRGALGSCLHKTENGEWVAYSRWPDKATRDASWPSGEGVSGMLSPEMHAVSAALKKCIDREQPYQEICMEVMDDLLLHGPTLR